LDPIRIFISYSHHNLSWFDEWEDELHKLPNPKCLYRQWERALHDENVYFWFDRNKRDEIQPGEEWKKRIIDEIDKADIAILMITPDFLVSPCIKLIELPRIKERYDCRKLLILPISVEPPIEETLEPLDLLQWQWCPEASTSLLAIFENSTAEFIKEKNKVLKFLNSMIKKVREQKTSALTIMKPQPEQAFLKETGTVGSDAPIRKKKVIPFIFAIAMGIIALLLFAITNQQKSNSALPATEPTLAPVQKQEKKRVSATPSTGQKTFNLEQDEILSFYSRKEKDDSSLQAAKKASKSGKMILIERGEFIMGSENGSADEKPPHKVFLSDFMMDTTEVTQEEYESVMGNNPSGFKDCRKCPVENVSWENAKKYCHDVGKQLPTEAQWEYARRAGTATEHGFGDFPKMNSLFKENFYKRPHPVGKEKSNDWGLYDMFGNMYEWCSDWYNENYYKTSQVQDPECQNDSSNYRVQRGCAWNSLWYKNTLTNQIRCSVRNKGSPNIGYANVGFRCVQVRFVSSSSLLSSQ
jgi:formylglycine-generating enzyme